MEDSRISAIVKVMVVGNTGVGKSSLILQFADKLFSHSSQPSIGLNFKLVDLFIRGQKVNLQIWDTSGQAKLSEISSGYMRCVMGTVIVFDLTDEMSFKELPNWISDEKAQPRMLLGNKSDRIADIVVKEKQAQDLANEHKMSFLQTSAKTGWNVDKAFESLVDQILTEWKRRPPLAPLPPVDPTPPPPEDKAKPKSKSEDKTVGDHARELGKRAYKFFFPTSPIARAIPPAATPLPPPVPVRPAPPLSSPTPVSSAPVPAAPVPAVPVRAAPVPAVPVRAAPGPAVPVRVTPVPAAHVLPPEPVLDIKDGVFECLARAPMKKSTRLLMAVEEEEKAVEYLRERALSIDFIICPFDGRMPKCLKDLGAIASVPYPRMLDFYSDIYSFFNSLEQSFLAVIDFPSRPPFDVPSYLLVPDLPVDAQNRPVCPWPPLAYPERAAILGAALYSFHVDAFKIKTQQEEVVQSSELDFIQPKPTIKQQASGKGR